MPRLVREDVLDLPLDRRADHPLHRPSNRSEQRARDGPTPEEAATRGARVLAVSAFLPALTGPGLTMAAAPGVEDVRHAVQAQIRPFVEDIVAGFSAGHGGVCPPVRVQVQATSPVWALVDAAREAGAELIVIGHRGRGALATRLLGSVGHGVLLQASCPVTMIPEPDDVAPEQELAAPPPADRQESPRPVGPIAGLP